MSHLVTLREFLLSHPMFFFRSLFARIGASRIQERHPHRFHWLETFNSEWCNDCFPRPLAVLCCVVVCFLNRSDFDWGLWNCSYLARSRAVLWWLYGDSRERVDSPSSAESKFQFANSPKLQLSDNFRFRTFKQLSYQHSSLFTTATLFWLW